MGAPVRGTKPRHPPAFLVEHQLGVLGQGGARRGDQGGELRRILDVAGEQDHPGRRVAAEQRRFVGGEGGAGEADDGGFHALRTA